MNGRIVRAVGGVTAASAVALLAVPMLASAHVVNQIDVSCTPTAYTGTADLGGSWGAGADVTQTLLVDRSVRKTAVVRVTSARQLTLSAPVGDVLEHLVTYRVTWAGNRALAEKRLTCRAPTPAPSPAPAPVAPTPAPAPPEVPAPAPTAGVTPGGGEAPAPAPAPVAPAVSPAASGPIRPRSACPAPLFNLGLIGPRRLNAGQQATFTFRVTNKARNPSPDTILVNPIPRGFSFVSATGNGTVVSSGDVRMRLGTMAPQSSRTVRVAMRVDRLVGGVRVNRGKVSGACGAAASAALPISVQALAPAVAPAVAG